MTSPSQILHAIHGSPRHELCGDLSSFICWVCGARSDRGVLRFKWQGANFTGQNRVRCPESLYVCEACVFVMAGRPPNTERMWSHLVEGKEHERVNKANKAAMREFLRRPHRERWFAAIADSGKKHIIPWAPVNEPWQPGGTVIFEETIVRLPTDEVGWSLIAVIADALTDGLTKAEIERGEYGPRAWQLLGAERLRAFEEHCAPLRGGSWFDLALWLAQRDEEKVAARMAAEKEAKKRGRTGAGKAAHADSGVRYRTADDVPADSGMQRAQALGSDHRSSPKRGKAKRVSGGVADGDVARPADLVARGEQLTLLS